MTTMSGTGDGTRALSWRTRAAIFTRLLAIQGSWNYETMIGTGIGFCTEPALRELHGGPSGPEYHAAIARESRYFNAHPYLAAVAVGALARAEVDGQPPAQIERFRAALCGPLGSVGDRLVWAGWLPFSALLALLAFGLGAGAGIVLPLFLIVYNVGHLGLRAWGLRAGWRQGLRVAGALGNPVLRRGPLYVARAVMLLCGIALPIVATRLFELPSRDVSRRALAAVLDSAWPLAAVGAAVLLGAALVKLHGRIEGWRVALVVLAALVIYSVAR
jgi:PTS system mannose-specific IID component